MEETEIIAAYLDRRLSAEEGRILLECLEGDQALYEVFVETLRSRERQMRIAARVIEHSKGQRERR